MTIFTVPCFEIGKLASRQTCLTSPKQIDKNVAKIFWLGAFVIILSNSKRDKMENSIQSEFQRIVSSARTFPVAFSCQSDVEKGQADKRQYNLRTAIPTLFEILYTLTKPSRL